MLLKLHREQSVKLKISIVFIWIIALSILAYAMYDMYLMFVDRYEYPAFSFMDVSYRHYLFMAFGVLVAVGLLFRSRVARWFFLVFAYIPFFSLIYYLFSYGTTEDITIYGWFLGIGVCLLIIYFLSHKDIQKVYGVKHLKWEIIIYALVTVLFYLWFTYYLNSITSDVENDTMDESNVSVIKGEKMIDVQQEKELLISKLEKTENPKLKAIIDALIENEHPFEHFLIVDWKSFDEDIIDGCESILKTGTLKAEMLENDSYHEYDVFIHYQGKRTIIDYGDEVYRWTTINTLNKVLKERYELKILRSSYDSDTSILLPLSHDDWDALENILGKNLVQKYFEFNMEILF